jgi:NAD(P)-dependent dehydrogenase (short-subunit alcohol dehydrogenase family)
MSVIVTGASRGLGRAIASALVEMGAGVVLNARSADQLAVLEEELAANGGHAVAVGGDISQPDTSRQLVEAALTHFDHLAAIVNNAGVLEPIAPLADADPAAWQRNLAINVLGPVLLTQAAMPHLRAQQGRVINVSSGAAVKLTAGWGAYCVAKAALNQFNRALALEEPEITAIAVRPGVVDTAMQALIRREGAAPMTDSEYQRFVDYHANDDLLPPELPGRAVAALALHAPSEWSGEFIRWNDDQVQALLDT